MIDKEWDGVDRRRTPKQKDRFYRVVIAGNVLVWLIFLGALNLFHYARPEQISGVQRFWGIAGREEWHSTLTIWLLLLLSLSTLLSAVLIFMHKQRNRRKSESWIGNLAFLGVVSFTFTLSIIQHVG